MPGAPPKRPCVLRRARPRGCAQRPRAAWRTPSMVSCRVVQAAILTHEVHVGKQHIGRAVVGPAPAPAACESRERSTGFLMITQWSGASRRDRVVEGPHVLVFEICGGGRGRGTRRRGSAPRGGRVQAASFASPAGSGSRPRRRLPHRTASASTEGARGARPCTGTRARALATLLPARLCPCRPRCREPSRKRRPARPCRLRHWLGLAPLDLGDLGDDNLALLFGDLACR